VVVEAAVAVPDQVQSLVVLEVLVAVVLVQLVLLVVLEVWLTVEEMDQQILAVVVEE
jgi:hypothetical protein